MTTTLALRSSPLGLPGSYYKPHSQYDSPIINARSLGSVGRSAALDIHDLSARVRLLLRSTRFYSSNITGIVKPCTASSSCPARVYFDKNLPGPKSCPE